ncbi:bacteriophage lambda tail assembly protein I [Caballeronia pedi]|uniref:Bacteriophage lambda tail assembly protein I n=1 Tax=Caballeronia pedi TaxID=1777141 RepID=A0A158B0N4_9BURK|nr:tail assembly protein [Caballeronia pedi]SAK63642.1 bacteriophage lambda tail assembly protein I [Caballeronia pedi]
MLTVRLYGDLGARFGRRYLLDVRSPAEAVHALCVQLPGLRRYFIEHATQQFRVRGVQDYDEQDMHYPQSTGTLKLVPMIEGAGAWGKVLGGAALAVIGAVAMAYGQPWGAKVIALGAALAMGGVAQMMAPRNAGTATPEKADNQPSLAFDGAVNTMGQGGPVPLGYGHLIVGSQIISVGFSTNNEVVIR